MLINDTEKRNLLTLKSKLREIIECCGNCSCSILNKEPNILTDGKNITGLSIYGTMDITGFVEIKDSRYHWFVEIHDWIPLVCGRMGQWIPLVCGCMGQWISLVCRCVGQWILLPHRLYLQLNTSTFLSVLTVSFFLSCHTD